VHLHPRRAGAVTALVALLSPPAFGLALAAHLLVDDHHAGAPAGDSGVELALHGHAHVTGTPSHGHPLVWSAAPVLPSGILAPLAVCPGDLADTALRDPLERRALSWDGPNQDPPPRRAAPPILRI
jgi:hypothetical protein